MVKHLILKLDGQNWCEEVNSKLRWSQDRSHLSHILRELGLSVSHIRWESCGYRNLELAETQRLVWRLRTHSVGSDKENAVSVNEAAVEEGLGMTCTKSGNKQVCKRGLIMPWFIVTGCAINRFMEVLFFSLFLSFLSKRLHGGALLPGLI